ncbi:hypothetical protein KFL_014360020 [Klebsormidium nitens]|uniref:Uncharacterized protein n=1 Tax=Klebsormidium nitens TaxID=105231 RepID=A0A1Y1IYC1_KLENI|nr:hypothetical protein KFL_014360020 [Klebsormidium nitens]|eukprot:GAQ93318.1 hypothetical protein KFL_014360020 [Klebsormidium nitens]
MADPAKTSELDEVGKTLKPIELREMADPAKTPDLIKMLEAANPIELQGDGRPDQDNRPDRVHDQKAPR